MTNTIERDLKQLVAKVRDEVDLSINASGARVRIRRGAMNEPQIEIAFDLRRIYANAVDTRSLESMRARLGIRGTFWCGVRDGEFVIWATV